MRNSPDKGGRRLKTAERQTVSTTFYSSKASHIRVFSGKKKLAGFTNTLYASSTASTNPSPSPDTNRSWRAKKSNFSPNRKGVYWQNWLLPQGTRTPCELERPKITASSMCAIFADTKQIFWSNCDHETRQIASLTKIMTALTVISICNTYNIKMRQTYIKIQKQASMMEGTSANLHNEDELLIIDLLYGLLLPSGNDAGFALAQYFGKFLSFKFVHDNYEVRQGGSQRLNKFMQKKTFYDEQYKYGSIKLFVYEMNKNAHRIGMKQTQFANPTGLTDDQNYSTASDMCLLISYCLKNHILRSIFKKKVYSCTVINNKLGNIRYIEWKNTNKHLFQIRQCIGVKTGITPGAGPCLSTAYRVLGRQIIVVLLNCATMEDRYVDAQQIYKYIRQALQKQHQAENAL